MSNKEKKIIYYADGTWVIDGKKYTMNFKKSEAENKKIPQKDRDKIQHMILEEDTLNKIMLVRKVSNLLYEALSDIDREEYFKDTLFEAVNESGMEELKDLEERLTKKPTIKKERGCFSLLIGGKRGKPLEFTIVGRRHFD